MVFCLTEGQRNEMVGFWPLVESGEVKLEPWELQPALFILGFVDEVVDEVAIAGALEALWIDGEIVA